MTITRFPRCDIAAREYADEFVAAWEKQIGMRWDFGPGDRKRILHGARELRNNFGHYCKGFVTWALPEHCKRLNARYVPSPWSLRWLWEEYQALEATKDMDFEAAIDEANRKAATKWKAKGAG